MTEYNFTSGRIDPSGLRVGDIVVTDHWLTPRRRILRYIRNVAADGTPNDFFACQGIHSVLVREVKEIIPYEQVDLPSPHIPLWSKHKPGDPLPVIDRKGE